MKNQIKKSLSLFMAVLMVLSCWVWVAPQKAEAANTPEEGYYYVEVRGLLDDWENDENVSRNNWKITTANGTYTLTSNSVYNGGANDTTGNYVHASGWVYGFPTGITHEFGQKNNGKSGTNKEYYGDGWGVRNVVVWAGAPDKLAAISTANGGYKTTQDEGSYSGSQITTFNTDAAPKFSYFATGSGSEIKLALNKIGGEDVSDGTNFTYSDFYDQYGVRWNGSANLASFTETGTPYISKTSTGSDLNSADIYYDSATGKVVAKASLQVNTSASNGVFDAYLVQKFKATTANGGTVTCVASAKITVTYPKYTVKFDGEGAISGLDYSLSLSDGTTTSDVYTKTGVYGAALGTVPNGKGNAEGYTFKGLWTRTQPTTSKSFTIDGKVVECDASYNAIEADFIQPISEDKVKEYKENGGQVIGTATLDDGTVIDEYILHNDVIYYNAGTEWSTNNKTISADATYYGWWLSKDINIKFYDIDGTYLGSKAVKFGQTQADITWPTPTESYVSGAYTYNNFNGTWVDINGDTVSQNGCTFTKELILTPKYDTVSFNSKYTVNFINENDGSNISGAECAYRTDLSAEGDIPADRNVPSGIRNDLQYSYTFEGWSTQKPLDDGNYHVLLEDGDFNTAGTAIAINSDWIVRSNMTFYPVYRRHLRTYAVNFWFKDSTGTDVSRKVTLKYGETLAAPTDYVPYTYAQEGYGYEFKNWVYSKGGANATFGYSGTLVFTKENIDFGLGAVEDGVDVTPVAINAAYGEPVATPYTVTFKYKNDKGEELTHTAQVDHGTLIPQDEVDKIVTADKYDNGEALVHYTGNWKVVEGAADKEEYATSELASFSPTSHITFEAVYGNPQPFYTVTYIDGGNTFEERILVDSNLPVWTTKVTNDNETPDDTSDDFEEDVEYLPTMADTAQGYYTFQGWYDEKQTDTTYAATNGNKYDATSKVTGNVTLYPQFKFSPFTYTIKFMDYEGKVQLAAGEYEYGQSIEQVVTVANKAAQGRAQDDTYTYRFIGWDKPVPEFCEGHDVTFIAQYQPVYRYYEAKWYNSVLVDGKWTADKSTKTEDDQTIETALLATSKHTYNSKVYNPSVAATCTVTPPAGQSYVFDGWYYNDADGNAQPYVRGMLITANMEFYATYKLTAMLYTVTTDVKGEPTEYKVAEGDVAAKAIADPNAGYVDATKHDEFAGWVTKDADGNETAFDIKTATITADITIYAKFTESEHDYEGNEELVTEPTYYAKGEKKVWCSCDAKRTEKTAEIEMLTDTVKPTGTIYLGTQGSWSSTDATGAAATDGDKVTLYANANTDIIITANDTGDVNALYNPSGIGKGVKLIRSFISSDTFTQEEQGNASSMAITVFEAPYELDENNNKVYSEDLNNTANYVFKLGDYETIGGVELEEGKSYIAYYYVVDKADNALNAKVRTAKFIYDNTAPVLTVEGKNNADKVAGTPTYCDTATVTGIEDGATLTVNGVAVANDAITWKTADEVTTGTYAITEAGNYLVTVADKAGNKTSKKFTVNDDHSYDVKEVLSTCTEDGYKTEICIVCGDEKDKVVYKTSGHDWNSYHVSSTCTEDGYNYKVCLTCGEEEKTYEVDGELIDPAHGHIYDKVDGEIVYTVVTEATCKTKGKEIATCKACGETISREIAIDEDAHNWGSVKTLKATCTEAGKTYKTCKLCYKSEDVSVIPATGHIETQWVETTAATCGAEGVETLQCKKCKVYVDSDDEDAEIDTREIPATGRHILDAYTVEETFWVEEADGCYKYILDDDGNKVTTTEGEGEEAVTYYQVYKTYEATADAEGQITRYCTQCGQEWAEKVDKIKKYTVKFVDENGTTEIKTIADVVSGTTITKDVVTEPTKENSADGKYKYTFAGWVELVTNEDGTTSDGDAVALPIDVTADITLKATYTQSTIIYTHQFKVPNKWISPLSDDGYNTFATMMGAMGDSRVPVAKPTFSLADANADAELKKLYTFKFLGWSTTGAVGDITEDFTIAGDATFYAVFEAEAVQYQVIYYNGTNYVWDTTVDGGETVTFGGTTPTKDSDDTNHYTFDKWYTDAGLKTVFDEETAITATTRLYAGFTATKHTYSIDTSVGEVVDEANAEVKDGIVQKATCILPELTQMICSCGHKITEETAEANGHTPAAAVEEKADDGTIYSVVYCSVEGCGVEISRTKTSVTVVFKYDTGVRLDTLNLNKDEDIVYSGETPTKASDAQYTYSFEGWYDEKDATKAVVTLGKATADVVYVAKFKATERTFRVTYVDADNKTLQTQDGIVYGGTVPAFTGTNPAKAYDDSYHYEFKEWSVAAGSEVTADIVIKPVYNRIKHVYVETDEIKQPTCTDRGGKVKECECGITYDSEGTIPALGHNFVQSKRVEPNYDNKTEGYIEYTCSRCSETKTETLSAELIEIKVTVKDTSGAVRSGVKVDLYVNGTETLVGTQNTDGNGVATFYVKPGEYEARVEGEKTYISVDENRNVEGGNVDTLKPVEQAPDCSCSCHKTSFWGILFRLFHKFIKLFTGKYICCDCPDQKYYK